MGFFCGLRRAEITNLTAAQVDSDQGLLVGFVRKGGGEGVFPYRSAVRLFAQRLPHLIGDPYVFLSALERRADARGSRLMGGGAVPRRTPRAVWGLCAALTGRRMR